MAQGIAGPSVCVLCRSNVETIDHLFVECGLTKKLISNISNIFKCELNQSFGFHDVIIQLMRIKFSPRLETNLDYIFLVHMVIEEFGNA